MSASIVTTVSLPRESTAPLASFLKYHLAIGFAHIFIFLDSLDKDTSDALQRTVESFPKKKLSLFLRDDALIQKQIQVCPEIFEQLKSVISEDHVARQALNASFASYFAKCMGIQYILNLDVDELFYIPEEWSPDGTIPSIVPHIQWLLSENIAQMTYANHEGFPVTNCDSKDYFLEIIYFKKHRLMLQFNAETKRCVEFWRNGNVHKQHFLFYDNGKSIANVSASERVVPLGCSPHRWAFYPPDIPGKQCVSFPDNRIMSRNVTFTPFEFPCILHFPVCGFDWFYHKYMTLGKVQHNWLGGRVEIGDSFHKDALIAFHGESGVGVGTRELYSSTVVLDVNTNHGKEELKRQSTCGAVYRLTHHVSLIMSFTAPELYSNRTASNSAANSTANTNISKGDLEAQITHTHNQMPNEKPTQRCNKRNPNHQQSKVQDNKLVQLEVLGNFEKFWILSHVRHKYLGNEN